MNLIEQIKVNDVSIDGYQGTYYIESSEYVKTTIDADGRLIEGIKTDGTKVIGGDLEVSGEIKINELSVGGNTTISGDATILGKVDIQGATYTLQENPEWFKVLTDAQDRIIAGVRKDGSVSFPGGIEGIASEEYVNVSTSSLKNYVDTQDAAIDTRLDALEGNDVTTLSFSKRCFKYGKKAPQKPCITITMDLLKNFSFGDKTIFDYITLLKTYGIETSTFFPRPTAGQIDSIPDLQRAVQLGQEMGIHSIHTDAFGFNDTENPHPSLADAETLIQDYQNWFKTNRFGYAMGWVTSRGTLYSPYIPLVRSYLSYAHTTSNQECRTHNDVSELYPYINSRDGDKIDIVRIGIEMLQEEGSDVEELIVNNAKALIDKTIEVNGFLCLYCHGYDNMSAPYTARETVLVPILAYLKQKLDKCEILAGCEGEIVPYFYD